MKMLEQYAIEALGLLLSTYQSDLKYVSNFKLFINGKIPHEQYIQKEPGYFQKFINEFKVTRNIKKEKVSNLLAISKEWVLGSNALDVDLFAKELSVQGITQDGKTMTSLASKILFLGNADKIILIDTQNRSGLEVDENRYAIFIQKINIFINNNISIIHYYLDSISLLISKIENLFIKCLIREI